MRKQVTNTKKPDSNMYAGTGKPSKPARPAAPAPSKKKPA
jgi:hypothetical protein